MCWELGGAYGHLGNLLPVARELQRRGHRISFVIRELTEAQRLLGDSGFPWYQAPLWTGRVAGLPEPLSHAELLMHFGFLNPQALLGVCKAWRHLFELLQPDLLVFDYSPTGQLAARGLPAPAMSLGTGFYVPPAGRPLPPFQWWKPWPQARLLDSQGRVETVCNQVLHELGAPLVGSLRDVLGCPDTLFTTLPELDHFQGRTEARFVGHMFGIGNGLAPAWPGGTGARVFGYLKPDYKPLPALLEALERLGVQALVHVPGAPSRLLARFATGAVRVCPDPLDIERVRAECDWAVLHGGIGSCTAMLLVGKPLVLLPQHTEQVLFSRSVEQLGAGVVLAEAGAAAFPRLLKRLLDDPKPAAAARAFAERHRDHDPRNTPVQVADHCEVMLARST